jgi:asparagine synthase (glutamine-hydrolysing)
VSESALARGTQSLHHRGPDGQRHWVSQDGRVGLGHARLSIIDLSTGDQPIASEDGRSQVIVNGEFYDYERIRKELQQAGHRLRTKSDSEIVLHLYQDVGPQCLHKLRGEFAFVLWDAQQRMLFAARDRFGIKPLFYAFHNETLYLASEVKALFAAGVPARWDAESVWNSIGNGGHQTRTLYEGVFQVPPGHYLLADEKELRIHRYWDFDYPQTDAPTRQRSDADYAAEFRHALDEAVRLRLRADVPVACYLSGGLDSCSVLGLAAKHHSDPVNAFTLTFDDAEYDEEQQAREMAARVGANFHPIPIRSEDLADNFVAAISQAEQLCINGHATAKFLLSRAVRNAGFKVVLTGEGSDEVLGGYAHFRRDMLLYDNGGQDPEAVARLLSDLNDTNPVSRGLLLPHGKTMPLTVVQQQLGFVPSWMETFSSHTNRMRSMFSGDLLERFGSHEPFHGLFSDLDVRRQLTGRAPVHQALYLWAKTMLPGYILTLLGDRMEMAHSIEGRVPFLDHHLVEVIRSQPVTQKIRGMTEKFVLREAARDVITDTIYRRQKHPFLSPPSALNRKDKLFALVQDRLRSASFAAIPFYDQKKVVKLLDDMDDMDDADRLANDPILMSLTSASVLQERFKLAA